ncbi:MAG TPA: outer membrane beta-barrel protein [Verrucomicrobiae bacterium]|nr:outer membrane beta-barrel protein [Verrucomicrobiae bacterium]
MNRKQAQDIIPSHRNQIVGGVLLGLFAWAVMAQAQQVVPPPPEATVTPPVLQPLQPTDSVLAEALGTSETNAPLQWGPVSLRPRVTYDFLYGTGILASPSNHVNSVIQQVSPGLMLGVGSHWTVDYAPLWTFYSNHQLADTLDHAATLAWGTIYEDWVLSLSQSYTSSSGPLVQTGGQTSQETYLTAATGSYRFSEAMLLELGVNQDFRFADKFTNYRQWSTMDWLGYQFQPQLNAALGAGFGYVDLDASPDQTYEQFQGRLTWRTTQKISLIVHGGVEVRQMPDTLINPIFGASLQYRPFEVTTFSLNADRTVAPSFFEGQVTETTSVTATLSQRFLERFYLTVGGAYNNAQYITSATGGSAGRTDNYDSFNARLSTRFFKRGTVAATYQYSDNSSTVAGFGYRSHQVGCEFGYRY